LEEVRSTKFSKLKATLLSKEAIAYVNKIHCGPYDDPIIR
jgi:hypothetical protein